MMADEQTQLATPPDQPVSLPAAVPSPAQSVPQRQRRRKRRSWQSRIRRVVKAVPWRVVLVATVLLMVVPPAIIAAYAADSFARVRDSLVSLQRVLTTLEDQSFSNLKLTDLDRLEASVDNLAGSLSNARQQTRLLRRVANLNTDLEMLFHTLDAASAMTNAANAMLEGVRPSLTLIIRAQQPGNIGIQDASDRRLVELLEAGQSRFITADEQLALALDAIQQIDLNTLAPGRLPDYLELIRYYDTLHNLNRTVQLVPRLLETAFGLENPQDFLILSQNNDELRPSGGYISTYGYLRVRQSQIVDFDYGGTTELSPNPPPDRLASTLDIPVWWFRPRNPIIAAWSGSWYADFERTAAMAAWYYKEGGNPRAPVDGVIGIDLTGFEILLGAIGNISVPGFSRPVNAANLRQVIYEVRANTAVDHKVFLAEIAREILNQWEELASTRGPAILSAAVTASQQKHLMLYFSDPTLQEAVELLGWSGAQSRQSTDYLMVADANLGNKSNSSVLRTLTYSPSIQADGSLKSVAVLDYEYPADVAASDPAVAPAHYGDQKDYYSLLQVFAPSSSVMGQIKGLQAPVTADERDGHAIFATGISVVFDGRERFEFSYTTPVLVERLGPYYRYRLIVQKQPGTRAERLNVQIKLPPGSAIVNVSPIPSDTFLLDSPIMEFRTDLTVDREIDIIYSLPSGSD